MELSIDLQNKNLNRIAEEYVQKAHKKEELTELLRTFDSNLNVNWAMAHYKSAVKHLQRKNNAIASTGGTNWHQYLPPRFQKKVFFPSLWSEEELEEWGKSWVEKTLANI